MKQVDSKDLPDVSGGVSPQQDGRMCTDPPNAGYPREPMVPLIVDPSFSDPTEAGGV